MRTRMRSSRALARRSARMRCARRWVVERTMRWLMKKRRLVVDYETLPETSESFIYITMVHLMLKRLANNEAKIA